MKKQLIKAKELLTRFVMASVYFNGKETDLIKEAEQFLKEPEEVKGNEKNIHKRKNNRQPKL